MFSLCHILDQSICVMCVCLCVFVRCLYSIVSCLRQSKGERRVSVVKNEITEEEQYLKPFASLRLHNCLTMNYPERSKFSLDVMCVSKPGSAVQQWFVANPDSGDREDMVSIAATWTCSIFRKS